MEGASAGAAAQGDAAQPGAPRRQGKLPCQFFHMGTCRFSAEECRFSHEAPGDCRPAALAQPCKHFMAGYCRNGNFCLNVHDREARDARLTQHNRPRPAARQLKPTIVLHAPIPALPAAAPPAGGPMLTSLGNAGPDPAPAAPQTQAQYHAGLQQEAAMYYYGEAPEAPAARPQPPVAPDWSRLAKNANGLSSPAPLGPPSSTPCRFFLKGTCAKGAACEFSHAPASPALAPASSSSTSALAPGGFDAAAEMAKFEKSASQDFECGVCLENIVKKTQGGRFGILTGCSHAFCLTCIKNWRSTATDGEGGRELVRRCPLCRAPSFFVVPCDRMVRDPERKAALVQTYRDSMRKIHCKHFARGDGDCPFGTSCFYAHVYANGQEQNPGELRTFKDADGVTKVDAAASLASYFDEAARVSSRHHPS